MTTEKEKSKPILNRLDRKRLDDACDSPILNVNPVMHLLARIVREIVRWIEERKP